MTEPHDDLPALDPRAAALLAAYRRARAMPPAARERVHDKLSGTCPEGQITPLHHERDGKISGTGPEEHVLPRCRERAHDEISGTGPEEHVLQLRRARRDTPLWAAAIALAAVAVLWFARRGADLSQQTADPATMSPAHAAGADATDAEARASDVPDLPPARVEVPPARVEAPAEPTPAAPPAEPRVRRDPRPAPPAALDVASSLRDEQELLARGWQSLAAGHADAAARDAAEHARRFPAGVLAPERQALQAAAACVDERERGVELARDFLAAHPRSPLARRVREACELAP